MNNRQVLKDLLYKEISYYLDNRYNDVSKEKCKELMNSSYLVKNSPHSPKKTAIINEFVVELMVGVAQSIYKELREETISGLVDDWYTILNNLMTDEDAEKLKEFVTSEVGKKILRNLDLYRESFAEFTTKISVSTMMAWTSPEIGEAINDFIESQTEDED